MEIIISIAALSFISVFILEMFLASSTVNKRARDIDIATAEAVSAIENFKKQPDFKSYLTSENIQSLAEYNDAATIFFFYDKDWNRMETAETVFQEPPPDTQYYLQLDISADDEFYPLRKEGVLYGELYNVDAGVVDMSFGDNPKTIVFLQAKKYFSRRHM